MKPWVVSTQLAILDRIHTLAGNKALDVTIYERAVRDRRSVRGLEAPGEQLAIFDSLRPEEQVEMLRECLEHRTRMRAARRDVLREMLEAYTAGDDALVDGLVREGYDAKDQLSTKLMKRVFTDRNKRMTDRALSRVRMAPNKTYFFAVGAGHIVGHDGVVARLERVGFKVERVGP
jgi:uncharacterized protein YbaP (TraB family)